MHSMQLGELLVRCDALKPAQVDDVLEEQIRTGEPFGLICERLFSVDPGIIERAWVDQYALLTANVDLEEAAFDNDVRDLITRRQAWQFCVLPIRFSGQELMTATCTEHLTRALRFATNVIGLPVYFVLTDAASLGKQLCERYPLPGCSPRSVAGGDLAPFMQQLVDSR